MNNVDLEVALKEHIRTQDELVSSRLKVWILTALVVQLLPLLAIAFFIGGIYQNLETTTAVTKAKLDLADKTEADRQRWELSIELWARGQRPPFVPPPKNH